MSSSAPEQLFADALQAGFAALAQGQWAAGRGCFEAALAQAEAPEAYEALGFAAYWQDDVATLFDSRERAYRLYRARGDQRGAGRMACMLADDSLLFRNQEAVSNGWLQRAHRLLDDLEPALEHGMLAAFEGFHALQFRHDVAAAQRASAEALAVARAFNSGDLEVGALSIEGLALVYAGRVAEGMRRLDEATTAALSGEAQSLDMIVAACCFSIYACERVRDVERAAQWCAQVLEFCERYHYRSMLAFCRMHYASVLIWRGAWAEAGDELEASTRELTATRVGYASEGLLRLGELRRRQGRRSEAAALFDRLPGLALSTLGRAALAFDAGDALAASDLVDRFLRQVPPDDLLERVDGLELALRVRCAMDLLAEAHAALAELEAAAEAADAPPLRGVVASGRGFIAMSEGAHDDARRCFEDAVDLFERCGAPYEVAKARLELARALQALYRPAAAAAEARLACDVFQHLGAAPDATRAAELLGQLGVPCAASAAAPPLPLPLPAGLTRREAEVLGLLGHGLSNQAIAAALFLSVRTVERHISTIYAKLGVEGSTARVAASAFALTHGLAPAATP
jgi:ATP/maltotriose-dependent transcriptional regulator MalT